MPRTCDFLEEFPTIEEVLGACHERVVEIWREQAQRKAENKRRYLERRGQL